ncbi:ras-related protein Rab-1A [Folsomia candida]|uniref:ras-related protein Rab-1A n=1 Tax=Folsomia candida TaxID=158441 RepID=UPI000B8F0A7D|nr:ras-related protein Rab-1A [Folsomia candida]XP_035709672.1 ras-related protein Rab-1A [Folsomia candida]
MTDAFSCALCLELYSDNGDEDYFVSTDCGHVYHFMCLKPSYDNGYNFCPVCRTELNLDKLRKLYGLAPKQKKKFPLLNFQLSPPPSAPLPSLTDEVNKEFDYKFKIILVGDAGVGKSSLLQRYSDDLYSAKAVTTVGCDWRSKSLIVGGKFVNLSIWDTVGQERHRSLVTNYVRDAHGALICYDITNEDSFTEIEYWWKFVKDNGLSDCARILVGTKTDLDQHRQVPKSSGKALAQKLRIPFFETSAKDSYNVEATFRTLAAKILETDSLLKEIEYRRTQQVGTLRLSRDQTATLGPLEGVCSYSWHWTKVGVVGAAKGIRNGWNAITLSESSSSSSSRNRSNNS